ncbi:predicted protein [Nematostella vectensis]|uniref:Uncharacterized protein n=1 Tax=Nematostella vectensis TaxID=45351 RepID=A7SET9_NEMVE|nr:predicted protein [Nematostella vectensis]|eukprot:XP_001629827.1 predicted protein [Nematostella vectensis]
MAGSAQGFFWNGNSVLAVLAAYLVRYWRNLILVYSTALLPILFAWKWIPESPRWLVAHGYVDKAHSVIMKYGPKKGKESVDSAALRDLIQNIHQDQIKEEKEAKIYNYMDLLRGRKLRKWSCILFYQWFSVALVTFGMYLFVEQLAGDLFVNYTIMRTVTTLRVFINWIVYGKWIPESPRWLVAHGYVDEAYSVIMKYGPKKGKESVDSAALRDLIQNIHQDQIKEEKEAKIYNYMDLLRGRKLRKWSCILFYQWFSVALVTFGMYLFVEQLAGNLFVNYTIMRTVTTLRVFINWIVYGKFGRRFSHGVFQVMTGLILLLILAVYKGSSSGLEYGFSGFHIWHHGSYRWPFDVSASRDAVLKDVPDDKRDRSRSRVLWATLLGEIAGYR